MGVYEFIGYSNEVLVRGADLVVVRGIKNEPDNCIYYLTLFNNILIIRRWIEESKEWVTDMVLSKFTLITLGGIGNENFNPTT
jgi:hypothetical protein